MRYPDVHHTISLRIQHLPLSFISPLLCLGMLFILAGHRCFAQHKSLEKVNKHLVLGDTSKALKMLNRQVEKHNTDAALYLQRAKIKIERRDYAPAMIDLNTFCSLNGTCGEAAFLKGLVLYKQGHYHGAIEHFSAYSTIGESSIGWFYLGLSHMALQHYQVAVHSFEKAIATDPTDVKAWYNAGLCAFRNEDYTTADSLLSAAAAMAPEDIDVLSARALTLTRQADFIESNRLWRQLLELDPANHPALYNIGVNYYNLEERELACDYWQRAVQKGSPAAELAISEHCGKK